jgi:transposase
MESAARTIFPNARLITDHFHVVKLVVDALQHIRIKLRWEELDKENKAIKQANKKLIQWIEKTNELKIQEFNSASNTINNKSGTILNYFITKSTNANAESFNAKIKRFRANLRGVTDTKFFLFRLEKLFA